MKKLHQAVTKNFKEEANPEVAKKMAAYMRTDMPFFGVPKPRATRILNEVLQQEPIAHYNDYLDAIDRFWNSPERELKYCAIAIARKHTAHQKEETIPFYESFIREGAWWDFVDEVAPHLIGPILLKNPAKMRTLMKDWNGDGDFWIRRASIIFQLFYKEKTKENLLYTNCLNLAHEKEFFIRKAIGWALRQYGKTAPKSVLTFLKENQSKLSNLSFKEGSRILISQGYAV